MMYLLAETADTFSPWILGIAACLVVAGVGGGIGLLFSIKAAQSDIAKDVAVLAQRFTAVDDLKEKTEEHAEIISQERRRIDRVYSHLRLGEAK